MSRPKSMIINDDNYFEYCTDIFNDTIWSVLLGLREFYTARFSFVPKPNYLAYNLMSISMFMDVNTQRMYLTYTLDFDRSVGLRVPDEDLYNNVYDKVKMIQKDYDIKASIIGTPTSKPEYSLNRSYGIIRENNKGKLRIDTQTLWENIPGPKDTKYSWFVQNKAQLQDDIRKNNMHPSQVAEYCQQVIEINKQYLDIAHPRYQVAFQQYQHLYKETFGRDLKPVEDWKIITVYFDVLHDSDAEFAQDEYHDMGSAPNFKEVREYIVEWAREHHKSLPSNN